MRPLVFTTWNNLSNIYSGLVTISQMIKESSRYYKKNADANELLKGIGKNRTFVEVMRPLVSTTWKYHASSVFVIISQEIQQNTTFFRVNANKSLLQGTGKNRTLVEAMRPLVSTTIACFFCFFWVLRSPNDILDTDPRCVFFLTGTMGLSLFFDF